MRKATVFLAGTVVLLAFMGLSASALASHIPGEDHDPLCDDEAGGYLPLGIYEQDIQTDPIWAYTPVNTGVQFVACSGEGYTIGGGSESLFKQFEILFPAGVYLGNTLGAKQGSIVGGACIGGLSGFGYVGRPGALGVGPCPPAVGTTLTVDNATGDRQCLEETRGEVIACFRFSSLVGFGYIWVWINPKTGGYVLTVGRPNSAIGSFSITRIESLVGGVPHNPPFLCAYVGCGKDGEPLFVSGGPGTHIYYLQGTRTDDQATDFAEAYVEWE